MENNNSDRNDQKYNWKWLYSFGATDKNEFENFKYHIKDIKQDKFI